MHKGPIFVVAGIVIALIGFYALYSLGYININTSAFEQSNTHSGSTGFSPFSVVSQSCTQNGISLELENMGDTVLTIGYIKTTYYSNTTSINLPGDAFISGSLGLSYKVDTGQTFSITWPGYSCPTISKNYSISLTYRYVNNDFNTSVDCSAVYPYGCTPSDLITNGTFWGVSTP